MFCFVLFFNDATKFEAWNFDKSQFMLVFLLWQVEQSFSSNALIKNQNEMGNLNLKILIFCQFFLNLNSKFAFEPLLKPWKTEKMQFMWSALRPEICVSTISVFIKLDSSSPSSNVIFSLVLNLYFLFRVIKWQNRIGSFD